MSGYREKVQVDLDPGPPLPPPEGIRPLQGWGPSVSDPWALAPVSFLLALGWGH